MLNQRSYCFFSQMISQIFLSPPKVPILDIFMNLKEIKTAASLHLSLHFTPVYGLCDVKNFTNLQLQDVSFNEHKSLLQCQIANYLKFNTDSMAPIFYTNNYKFIRVRSRMGDQPTREFRPLPVQALYINIQTIYLKQ